MSLGPVVANVLPYFRNQAASLMIDTCVITRVSADNTPTLDPLTLQNSYPDPTVVYTGPCRVVGKTRFDKVVQAGGNEITLYRFIVNVPVQDILFEVDDLVTVTAAGNDPSMVGVVLRVRQPEIGTDITERRLGCELNAG